MGSSIEFFMYDTPKVLLLLTLVVFAVGVGIMIVGFLFNAVM